MANRLSEQLGGVINVKVRGERQEKVINMALARGIHIWDIKKTADGMNMKVRASGFDALNNICDENAYTLEVINRKGFPFFKGIFKRRLGFWGGAVIFIAALYFMSSFIWFIDVSGNKKMDKNRIIMTAAKHGVYKGAAKWTFSRNEAEESILRDLSELVYVKIDIRGIKANIEVVEKIFPREEITGPCHIVSAKDGVVEEVLVLEGQASVKPGDTVSKGDILISGICFPTRSEFVPADEDASMDTPYAVRARGRVKARVWYEGYGECKLRTQKLVLSGKESSEIYIEIPGRKIQIKGRREKGFLLSKQKMHRKTIATPLGNVGFSYIVLQEQKEEVTQYTESQAVQMAREKAMKLLLNKLKDDKNVTNAKTNILSSPSDSIIRVKVSAETIENIAVAEPINVGLDGN